MPSRMPQLVPRLPALLWQQAIAVHPACLPHRDGQLQKRPICESLAEQRDLVTLPPLPVYLLASIVGLCYTLAHAT